MHGKPTSQPFGTGKLPTGRIVGNKYSIVRKIAQGGMGAVYEIASTANPDKRYALKEMSFSMLASLPAKEQLEIIHIFRQEYQLLQNLRHPNLIRVYDFFEENNRQYYVMELLDGETVENILDALGTKAFLSTDRVLSWARQLCDVLSYLHAQVPPVIYRDLKPSNIIELKNTQTIKIFDFGIARFYKPGQKKDTIAFGTIGYLAPEIVGSQSQTSEKTDVYALGVLLHQLLTGYDPQRSPMNLPDIRSINATVPEHVVRAVEHALQLAPDQRTANAVTFMKELFGQDAQPAWKSQMAPPIELSSQGKPGTSTQAGVPVQSTGVTVSPLSIAFGSVKIGQTASASLQVKSESSETGYIRSSVAWLVPQQTSFTRGVTVVNVLANTHLLSPKQMQSSSKGPWYRKLAVWVQELVSSNNSTASTISRRHEGKIRIHMNSSNIIEIPVTIETVDSM